MGRPYTGADYTTSARKLKLKDLLRGGVIRMGETVEAVLSWGTSPAVRIRSTYLPKEKFLELTYQDQDGTSWTQRVELTTLPSNLGRGEVVYFLCPRSGKRCRILYQAYHSRGFYHREAFSYRLYYPSQAVGKLERANDRYHRAEAQLMAMDRTRKQETYQGKPTRRTLKREKLLSQLEELDNLRWSPEYIPKRLQAVLGELL